MLEGSWLGILEVNAIKLRIVINFKNSGTDSPEVTIDSPDQSAYGIPAGLLYFENDSISVGAPSIMGRYSGNFDAGSKTFKGQWFQGPLSLPLNLEKSDKEVIINRPQEPKPPFPYMEKEVNFRNTLAGIQLAGTLTLPAEGNNFPAVVLISVSGPQNRDEETFAHKPFLVIADFLTRNGIAVLRYDDRGTSKSEGAFGVATTFDFALDAESAVRFLQHHPDINSENIGVIGHSEGALIAAILASKKELTLKFAIMLAGPGVPGDQIIVRQGELIQQAMGVDPEKIKEDIGLREQIFNIINSETDDQVAQKKIAGLFYKFFEDSEMDVSIQSRISMEISNMLSPWFRNFLSLDPYIYLKDIRCPVLVINGEKDLQVDPKQNLPVIEEILKEAGNLNYKIVEPAGLNHMFQHTETGLPSEYSIIEETFSEDVLIIIAEWIKNIP
ncbi:MAG: alpha/beta fold hydrolase [Bacteroidales bacterium]|nr:alpha/beta fold hydrolase [Bacteroidales bacterium]